MSACYSRKEGCEFVGGSCIHCGQSFPPKTQLTTGAPVPADYSHTKLRPDGQQEGYIVLSPEERAKGFVRPVRRKYVHLRCGVVTTMGQSLAETYARDPGFYSGTFCAHCKVHRDVGEDGEFVWEDGSNQKVGT